MATTTLNKFLLWPAGDGGIKQGEPVYPLPTKEQSKYNKLQSLILQDEKLKAISKPKELNKLFVSRPFSLTLTVWAIYPVGPV